MSFTEREILETIRMVALETLDIRTTTLGINLMDCADPDLESTCEKIYAKVVQHGEELVSVADSISSDYGVPIVNKRIAVTPISWLVGASGAISGVIAAYLLIWPRANMRVFYWFFIFVGTINVPAFVVLGLWVVEQLFALPAAMQAQGGIAIVAHLGGFASGLALTPFLKRRGVSLFQSPHSAAFAHSRTRYTRRRGGSVPEVRRKRD